MQVTAVIAAAVAFTVASLLTPVVARYAKHIGAIDPLRERGLAKKATPLCGGVAIFIAVLVASVIFLPISLRLVVVLASAAFVMTVGVIDDIYEVKAIWKLSAQILAAIACVASGIRVGHITLPFIHHVDFGVFGAPLTVLGLVAVMNAVNFSDGADGLAAGVCAISAVAMTIIAFDLHKDVAAVLAAIIGGAAIGFLIHNFYPASVFMGDSGSNLLGLLLGVVMVEGSVKTNALIALFIPLMVFAVPFLDTGFVIAKRLKNRTPVYRADSNHFHHRFHRKGFSQRKTVMYLYGWTLIMSALAVSMRFIPYTDGHGNFQLGGSIVMAICFLIAFGASVYLIYVLELLKFRKLRARQLSKSSLDADEIDAILDRELQTGEFEIVSAQESGGTFVGECRDVGNSHDTLDTASVDAPLGSNETMEPRRLRL